MRLRDEVHAIDREAMRAFAIREDHDARGKPPTRQSDAFPEESTRCRESGEPERSELRRA